MTQSPGDLGDRSAGNGLDEDSQRCGPREAGERPKDRIADYQDAAGGRRQRRRRGGDWGKSAAEGGEAEGERKQVRAETSGGGDQEDRTLSQEQSAARLIRTPGLSARGRQTFSRRVSKCSVRQGLLRSPAMAMVVHRDRLCAWNF